MRIAVLGAGGIGGFVAAALARSGADVGILARGAHLAAIRERGLRVESELGALHVRLPASDALADLGPRDVLLATAKAHQWLGLLDQVAPYARAGSTVVTLQNGVPFWFARDPELESVDPGGRIGALFPDAQVVGGVVHASGTVAEPGVVVQSGGMRYPLGDPAGGVGPVARALVAAFAAAGLAPEADEDIRQTVWLKLVNNVGLNPVSTLRRVTVRAMLADSASRAEVRGLMLEAIAVGRAIGAIGEVDVDARIAYASRIADVKTSMLQDYERGRALETGPILGAAIELADRSGIEVPLMRAAFAALSPC